MAEHSDRSLDGQPLEDAARAVSKTREVDMERARELLHSVTDDGVVSRAAVSDRLGHVAKLVATPESRVEFAEMALESARELAEPVADRPVVQFRLEQYRERLADVESQLEGVQTTLKGLLDRADSGAIFELARDLEQLGNEANAVQRQADELYGDLEDFQDWLSDEQSRWDGFADELDLVETKLEELAGDHEAFQDDVQPVDRGRFWFDLTLRTRVVGLLVADLRTEFETLRDWPDDGADGLDWRELETRLESLANRQETITTDLEEAADPDWEAQFSEPRAAFSATIEGVEPPIDWTVVQSALETHRPSVQPLDLE